MISRSTLCSVCDCHLLYVIAMPVGEEIGRVQDLFVLCPDFFSTQKQRLCCCLLGVVCGCSLLFLILDLCCSIQYSNQIQNVQFILQTDGQTRLLMLVWS